jgi:hypothetical protein
MEEEYRKRGLRTYRERWKSFSLDVIVVKETEGGRAFVTRNVQVPIRPRAVQLKIFGLESRDAEMADLTRTLLASLDGSTDWLTEEQRGARLGEGIARMLFWIAAIGAGVYGLCAWRTGVFWRKALAAGLSTGQAQPKIRPHWGWYLFAAYLSFASLVGGGVASAWSLYEHSEIAASILFWTSLGQVLALAILVAVLARRVQYKRRILASAPPIPPPPH